MKRLVKSRPVGLPNKSILDFGGGEYDGGGRAHVSSPLQYLLMRMAVVVPLPGRDYHVLTLDDTQERLGVG